jgi:hypothetical protein
MRNPLQEKTPSESEPGEYERMLREHTSCPPTPDDGDQLLGGLGGGRLPPGMGTEYLPLLRAQGQGERSGESNAPGVPGHARESMPQKRGVGQGIADGDAIRLRGYRDASAGLLRRFVGPDGECPRSIDTLAS